MIKIISSNSSAVNFSIWRKQKSDSIANFVIMSIAYGLIDSVLAESQYSQTQPDWCLTFFLVVLLFCCWTVYSSIGHFRRDSTNLFQITQGKFLLRSSMNSFSKKFDGPMVNRETYLLHWAHWKICVQYDRWFRRQRRSRGKKVILCFLSDETWEWLGEWYVWKRMSRSEYSQALEFSERSWKGQQSHIQPFNRCSLFGSIEHRIWISYVHSKWLESRLSIKKSSNFSRDSSYFEWT